MRARRSATPGVAASFAALTLRDCSREFSRLGGGEGIAVHHSDRRPDRVHVRLRQRPPAAADRVEHRPGQLARQAPSQNFIDLPLRGRGPLRQHGFDRQGAERQADPAISHMVVDRFRDFETAAAHVTDRSDWPEEAGNNPKGREPRFLGPAEDTHLQAGLGLNRRSELRPVRSATDGLRRHGVDSADPHGLGDGAKSPHGLDRSTKMVRRDCAGRQPVLRRDGRAIFH